MGVRRFLPARFRVRWLFMAAALACLTVGVWEVAALRSTVNPTLAWPSVTGEIDSIAVGYEDSNARFGKGYRSIPEVRYRYTVDGERLRGTRIYAGRWPGWKDEAAVQAFLADYPEGAPVTVYYDPANPRDAVLLREGSYSMAWLYFGLTVFFLLPALFAYLFDRAPQPPEPQGGAG